MLKLTYQEALASLKKAVETRGEDWIYPDEWRCFAAPDGACRNFLDNGEPGCIAGFVYSDHGKELERGWESSPVHELVYRNELVVDVRTRILLSEAQREQDRGHTWGEAVAYAEKMVEAHDRGQYNND